MNIGNILILMQIDKSIAILTSYYVRVLSIGLWPQLLMEAFKRYLQAQGITKPSLYITLLTIIINIISQYILVIVLKLGFIGSPIATIISLWNSPIVMLLYMLFTKIYKNTWGGFTIEAFYGLWEYLKLGIPGAFMVCLEWWNFEVTVLEAGYLGANSIDAHVIFLNLLGISFSVPLGLGVAVSTRVGNHLGAGKVAKAKISAKIAILINLLITWTIGIIFFILRKYYAYIYTSDAVVLQLYNDIAPLAAIIMITDGLQGVSSGVLRGAGRPTLGVVVNLISYWIIGLPVGWVLAFIVPWGVHGLWWGILLSQILVVSSFIIYFKLFLNWDKAAQEAQQLSATNNLTVELEPLTEEKLEQNDIQ